MARTKKTTARRSRSEASGRLAAMAKVAAKFEGWAPAGKVLTRVVSVPTDFLQLDWKARAAGYPIQRTVIIHGPTNMGKTALALGLGGSFLKRNHFFAYVDAEYTTPEDWLQKLLGEWSAHPGFVAMRPQSYEEVVEGVRRFVDAIAKARIASEIPADTSGLIVVDSLQKMVPKRLLDKMIKGKDGIDGAKGRGAMMQAAVNSQWLKELTPLLYHTRTGICIIVREYDKPDAGAFEEPYKVGGGRNVELESSLTLRVTRDGWVKRGDDVVGERHLVTIRKTKVGGKEDKRETAHFYTSNGTFTPEGFDHPRAAVEMALAVGAVKKARKRLEWLSTGEVWSSENDAVRVLTESPRTYALLEEELRGSIAEAVHG
jgi:RecA/RadA recombinase